MNSNRDAGRSVGAMILIGLGALFLAGQVFGFDAGSAFGSVVDRLFSFDWPFYVILPGVVLWVIALAGPIGAAGLAIPGSIIAGTGAILLFQERFDRFESWSYMWALYPVFVGAGLMFMGARSGIRSQTEAGRRSALVGLALFVIFGVFMEGIFTGGFDLLWRYGLPLLLIGGGAFLLLRGRSSSPVYEGPKRKREDAVPLSSLTGKRKNERNERLDYGPSATVTPSLQRQIDAALTEDDGDDPDARS